MILLLLPEKFGELLSLVWIVGTVLVGVSSALFFHFHSDVQLKRGVFRFLTIVYGAGYLMMGFMLMRASLWFLLFGSGVVLMTYFSLRQIDFCNACGNLTFDRPFTAKLQYCPKCGAQLLRVGRNT